MSTKASETSLKYLDKLGVQVITETFVKDYDGVKATLSNGKAIPT